MRKFLNVLMTAVIAACVASLIGTFALWQGGGGTVFEAAFEKGSMTATVLLAVLALLILAFPLRYALKAFANERTMAGAFLFALCAIGAAFAFIPKAAVHMTAIVTGAVVGLALVIFMAYAAIVERRERKAAAKAKAPSK